MLSTKDLEFGYKGSSSTLKFPDINCQKGEHWLLLGQSGSGKTTFLQLISGLRTPQKGAVHIGETNITNLSKSALDKFRGQQLGIVFQQSHFVKSLTVQENLSLAQKMAKVDIDKAHQLELLNRLNIGHKANSKPQELSQGEQQRAAIARALVNKPMVILADEPTSALDDTNTDEVIALLKEQAKAANATLIIITHDNRLKSQFEKTIML